MSERRSGGYPYTQDATRTGQWIAGSNQQPSRYPQPPNPNPSSSSYPHTYSTMTHNVAPVQPGSSSVPYGMSHPSHGSATGHHASGYPSPPPAHYASAAPHNTCLPRQPYPSPPDRVPPSSSSPQYPTASHSYPSHQVPSQPSVSGHPSSSYFGSPQYPASPARPYSCDLCALSFNRQHDLKRHRETHSGEKPFSCNGGCGKTFTRKDALKRHQLVKHCGHEEDGS